MMLKDFISTKGVSDFLDERGNLKFGEEELKGDARMIQSMRVTSLNNPVNVEMTPISKEK